MGRVQKLIPLTWKRSNRVKGVVRAKFGKHGSTVHVGNEMIDGKREWWVELSGRTVFESKQEAKKVATAIASTYCRKAGEWPEEKR